MKRVILIILAVVNVLCLKAGPIIWSGGGDAMSWKDPDNWDTGTVPDANDVVTISGAAVIIHSGTLAFAESMTCNGSLTIEIGGVLSLEGGSS